MKSQIYALLAARGPLTLERLSEALGHPAKRTLSGWLYQLRYGGEIVQTYTGCTDVNGRAYLYEIAPAFRPLPGMRATAHPRPRATGTTPENCRRLMQPE